MCATAEIKNEKFMTFEGLEDGGMSSMAGDDAEDSDTDMGDDLGDDIELS